MNNRIYTPINIGISLSLSLIFTMIGAYIFPVFFEAGTKTENAPNPLIGAVITIAAILLSIFLLSLLFAKISKNPNIATYVKGLFVLLLAGIVAIFVVSMVNGLIAVLLNALLKNTLTIDQIKGIINIVTGIISLLILPVFINVLLTFAFDEPKAVKSISKGLKSIKKRYIKILILLMILSAAGYLIGLPFNYITLSIIPQIIKSVLFTLVGAVGILAMLGSYGYIPQNKSPSNKNNFKKKNADTHVSLNERETVTVGGK